MSEDKLVEVSMVREHLHHLPPSPLPPPYTLRFYRPGDAATWVRVQREAEDFHTITEAHFFREFGADERLLAARQYFLCDGDGREVGTATAWFDDSYRGLSHGRIHWVAVARAAQGRGLGRVLCGALCRRFVELGHGRAYLTTETVRLQAIRLYLSFGFVPEIKDERDVLSWQGIRARGVELPVDPAAGLPAGRPIPQGK